MSDKVGGRGHKISPIAKGMSKIAYSPCPKIDPDIPDNCLNLGILPTPTGLYYLQFFSYIFLLEILWK